LENIKPFQNAALFWVQEEHMNQGSWVYVQPRIEAAMKLGGLSQQAHVEYVGRPPSAATASGHHDAHEKELENFLKEAFAN
jgi:2-oxoglutarate dehydrogenase E1 component